jgi:tetratricopeptide (TPR) repeat protein
MGVILSHRGRFEDASTAFMRAIQLDRNNATAHFNYALLLFDIEKYKDAEEHLKRSLSLNTGSAEAQLILGMLYRRTGKSDLALTELEAVFEEVVQKRADFKGEASDVLIMSALHTLSELYAEKGDEKKALSALRKAMEIILGLEGGTDRAPLHRGRDFMMYE